MQQLRQFGEMRRGWLGVKIQTVTDEIAEASLGITENTGALVAAVTPEGPAAKGGVQSGDVILKFDGKDVDHHARPAAPRRAQTPIGKDVDVELLRKGQKMTLQVAVGRLTEDEDVKADLKGRARSEAGRLGKRLVAGT